MDIFNLRSSGTCDFQSDESGLVRLSFLNEKHKSMSKYPLTLWCRD